MISGDLESHLKVIHFIVLHRHCLM